MANAYGDYTANEFFFPNSFIFFVFFFINRYARAVQPKKTVLPLSTIKSNSTMNMLEGHNFTARRRPYTVLAVECMNRHSIHVDSIYFTSQ